jgi:hypothetical protein
MRESIQVEMALISVKKNQNSSNTMFRYKRHRHFENQNQFNYQKYIKIYCLQRNERLYSAFA